VLNLDLFPIGWEQESAVYWLDFGQHL
jgi:hypothetical protein